MSGETIMEILQKYHKVAVIGLSNDPSRPSYIVAEYLKNHGFQIIPVNPFINEALGLKSFKSLREMPAEIQETVEIVDVFRRSEEVPQIVEQALQLKSQHGKPYVIWLQLGVINEQGAEAARKAGLTVIMNKCMRIEYHRLLGKNEKL